MAKFLMSLIRPREKEDDKNEEQVHSGASLTEQRLLEEVDVLLQRMRPHFVDDPDALEKWEEYERAVRMNNLSMSPLHIANPVAYERLMQRKAWSRTLVGRVSGGLEKLKQAATVPPTRNKTTVRAEAIIAGVAAAFALGLALGRTQLHGSRTNEMEPS